MASRKFFNTSRHSQDLSAVLGESLSPGDSHHIKNNTMDFKCLLRNIDGGKRVLSLGTLFQIAAELRKVFPSPIKRSIPLASGQLLLEAVSSQALCSIINRGTVSFLGSRCRAILPNSLRKVEGVMARIPEEEDLACLGSRLTTSPDLQCLEGTPHLDIPDWWGFHLWPRPDCPGMWGWGTPPVY